MIILYDHYSKSFTLFILPLLMFFEIMQFLTVFSVTVGATFLRENKQKRLFVK